MWYTNNRKRDITDITDGRNKMAEVKQFSIDILVCGHEDTNYLEEKIAEAIEKIGITVYGVAFADDMTEYYKEWLEE